MQKKKWIGNILLVLTALIWGTAFVFQRVGMESIEPITFTAARMSIAAAAVGLVTVIAHRIFKKSAAVTPTTNRRLTVIGGIVCGVFLASASILQQIGIVDTSAGKAGFITSLYILMAFNHSISHYRHSLRCCGAVHGNPYLGKNRFRHDTHSVLRYCIRRHRLYPTDSRPKIH